MATHTERREVARRLRGLNGDMRHVRRVYEVAGISVFCEDQADYYQICDAVAGYLPAEHMHPCDYKELHERLADLIEPGEPKVKCVAEVKIEGDKLDEAAHRAMAEYTGIDREALLALADELEEDACWEVQTPGDTSGAWRLKDACDRIREACGMVDAG